MRTSGSVVALATLVLTAAPAHADVDAKVKVGAVVGANALPTAALLWSLRSKSHVAGGVEIATGLGVGAINIYVASVLYAGGDDCDVLCRAPAHLLVGMAALDAVVAVHGVWTATRDEPTLVVGSARGIVSPTVVSDGRTYAAGLGIGGTF